MNRGTITVQEAADWLGVEQQTIRIMLQQGIVPWGLAFKRPGSKQFAYLIYRKQFEDLTGYDSQLQTKLDAARERVAAVQPPFLFDDSEVEQAYSELDELLLQKTTGVGAI